jgi:hypothetical protein
MDGRGENNSAFQGFMAQTERSRDFGEVADYFGSGGRSEGENAGSKYGLKRLSKVLEKG